MRVFISQKMNGLTDEEILKTREEAIRYAKFVIGLAPGDEFEFIDCTDDSYFRTYPEDSTPLWFLGKSIELLSTADVCLFVGNWETARGCRIEHNCCLEYEIPRVYFKC